MNNIKNSIKIYLKQNRKIRQLILIFIDYTLILISTILSYKLIYKSTELNFSYFVFSNYIAIFSIFIYYLTGQYKSLTRYFESLFLYVLTLRNLISFIFLGVSTSLFFKSYGNSSFWITLLISTSFFVGGARLILRDILIRAYQIKFRNKEQIVIYGAGIAGSQLANALKNNGKYKINFIVDDDNNLWHRNLGGIKIYPKQKLISFKNKIDKVFLAIPSLNKSRRSSILNELQELDLDVLSVNSLSELVQGNVKIDSLNPISIEDLLYRDSASSDPRLLGPGIINRTICVVGGGGSIGSELTRQIIKLKPKKLIILDLCEHNLYKISQELNQNFPDFLNVDCVLGNALNEQLINDIFSSNNIDVVFHAAAYKHVPIVEENPIEGIYNNVFTTEILCKIASKNKVSEFILLSTDKAVRPTNVMGASKRLAELVVQAYAELENSKNNSHKTKFSMVRFGNVLNSSGSVVPLFRKQIAKGGPITITHEEVTRYFMSIEEASQLVIQSAVIAKGGDLFLLDMGRPIKIINLAKKMIKLSGNSLKDDNNPEGDIEIAFTGLRKGEKLYEELLIDGETEKTINPLIFTAKEKSIEAFLLNEKIILLKKLIQDFNEEGTLKLLKELVPEWKERN